MEKLTIGQLAKKANVNLETIRYYERRGLIPEPPRNNIGHREYSIEEVIPESNPFITATRLELRYTIFYGIENPIFSPTVQDYFLNIGILKRIIFTI